MNLAVGIRSLAVSFPSIIRTNEYWHKKFPHLFPQEKLRKAKVSTKFVESTCDPNGLDIWSQEVAPYLSDPFRGSVERRVLGSDESSLMLEYCAAKDALDAAKLSPNEVDLMIVASLFGEHIGPGSASYLAYQLELHCPAWNLESTCSSALVALQNAYAFVQNGLYRNVLVVVSQIGSHTVDEEDTLSWSMGDGAGAFVVDLLRPNQGILSTKIVNTAETRGAYCHELTMDAQGKPWIRTRTGENISSLAETSVDFVRKCCSDAVTSAGLTLEQIDFFAFNTPTAWYASVCKRALGIDPERTINLYPRYANIGSVLPISNLYHAAQAGKIRENDLVLVYTNGATATAAATVMRWGDVALGSVPAPPISVTQEDEKIHPAKISILVTETKTSSLSKQKILATPPEERQRMLESYLLESISSSLQLPLATLNQEESFASFVDSLMALVLKNRIEADLQVRVPLEKFFDDKNVVQLAEFLLNQLVLTNLIVKELTADTEFNDREKLRI